MKELIPNLRTQIIEAMHSYESPPDMPAHSFTARFFDEAIMPILQKSMDAGDLLLSRNTGPRIPVPEAILNWIRGMAACARSVKAQEATISKREALNIIYNLASNAQQALNDIERG